MPTFTREDHLRAHTAMVAGLVAAGVPREKAVWRADQELGPLTPDPAEAEREARLEKAEQRAVYALYRAMGCGVYWLSQARMTKQTPGLPDLWVVHGGMGHAWWHETKRPKGGRQSEAQQRFQRECELAHVAYVLGGVPAAEAALLERTIAVREGGQLVPAQPWIQIAEQQERHSHQETGT